MGTEEYSANLRRAVRQLQDRSRIGNSLKPLPKRGTIASKAQRGKRTSGGSGVESPITEAAGTRTFHAAVKSMTSSDGLFVLEYRAVQTISTTDGAGRAIVFVYDNI